MLFVKILLAFYNYFLKTQLNCDKEDNVNFKYIQFSKEDVAKIIMYPNSFIDKICSWRLFLTDMFWKICEICRRTSMMELAVKEVTESRVSTFLNKVLCQIYLRNLQNIQYN